MIVFLIIGSLLIAVGRFLIPGHELSLPGTYEASAHIWVGVLMTLACQFALLFCRAWDPRNLDNGKNWLLVFLEWLRGFLVSPAGLCLTTLTMLEVAMFLNRPDLPPLPPAASGRPACESLHVDKQAHERLVIDGFTIERQDPIDGVEWFEVETGEPVVFLEIRYKDGKVARCLMPNNQGPKGGVWDRYKAQEKQLAFTVPVAKDCMIFLGGKQLTVREYLQLEPGSFFITDIGLGGEPGELVTLMLKAKKE